MTNLLLARQLFTPLEAIGDAAVVIEDGIITAIGTRANTQAPADQLLPDDSDCSDRFDASFAGVADEGQVGSQERYTRPAARHPSRRTFLESQ